MNGPARAYPATLLLLLSVSALLADPIRADPTVTPDGGGFKRATWDFATPADYSATNVNLAAGDATLVKTPGWRNYTNDAEFLAAQQSANRVVVNSGVRLQGNTANLISDGTFDQDPGPWIYTNGTNGFVIAQREGTRGKMSHATQRAQFDSTDDVAGSGWGPAASLGVASTLSQDNSIFVEGTGSLRDDLDFTLNPSGWGGAARSFPGPGTWNWSAFNRLAFWMNSSAPVSIDAYVDLQDGLGFNSSLSRGVVSGGWARYVFDLSTFGGNLSQIDRVEIRFDGYDSTVRVNIDDIALFNYTAFDEAATISQTFNKPNPTSGNPGSVVLRFDLEATGSVNVLSYVQASVAGSPEWFESPVAVGTRNLYVDLSGNLVLRNAGNFVLEFALQLTRNGPEEASMAVWIDNVTLTATDHQSGSFTALPWDGGSSAIWTTATSQFSTPPSTSIVLETRTGNTSTTGDPTWSSWQSLSGIQIQSPPNRYLQWRLLLNTANGSQTPVVTRLDLAYEKHVPSGVVRTIAFLPAEPLIGWRRFFASDARPAGTAIGYELSTNGGAFWSAVVHDADLTTPPNNGLTVRATLFTANTSLTPRIAWFALRYEFLDVLDRITVSPPDVTLTADESVTFTATAFDPWGHVIATFGCDWQDTDPVGTVNGSGTLTGTYFAGRVGSHRVYCYNSDQTIGGVAFVNVTAGDLASMRVCPSPPVSCPPTTLMPVATRKDFLAEGSDGDGNAVPLAATSWSTTIGQVSDPNETAATLAAPPTPGTGRLTARIGAISGGINVIVTPQGSPRFNGTVPDLVRAEDSGAYTWALQSYAENQPDVNDTLENLMWSLTNRDPSLYSVFGQDTFGRHTIVVTPRPDAHGIDGVTLWLEDRSGARASQGLQIRITPVNDGPAWVAIPEVRVKGGENYTLDLLPYLEDVDTAASGLTLTTEDPTHIATDALNATYGYPSSFNGRTLFVRHRISDGSAYAEVVVTVRVSSNPPPVVVRPLPDLTIPEDTLAQDVFAPDSLTDFFEDPGGETVFFSYNYTNLVVTIRQAGARWVVDVRGTRDFCGVDRITFRAEDARKAFAEYTVRVTVTCVNDAPVLAWTEDVHVAFNLTYPLDLTPYISDVDNPPEDLTLATGDLEHAAVDRFTVSFLYSWYEFGGAPTPSVDLIVADLVSWTMRTIDVILGDDRPPELVLPFEAVQFNEDDRAQVDLTTHFADPEGSVLTYAIAGRNVTATISAGQATLNTTRQNWFGQEVVLVRATDPQGAFVVSSILVDVLPVNDEPVFLPIPSQRRANGGMWVVDLRPYVTDVDDPVTDLAFSVNNSRASTVGFLLILEYPDQTLAEQIVVTATDPGGLSDTAAVSVRVDGPSIWNALLWPWSGVGALAMAALAYVAWTRFVARRFSIEDLFLVGREGRLIMHTTRRLRADRDPDILTGMLTAIMLFVRDSFREENEDLKRFEFGDRKVAVERSEHTYAAAIFSGDVPQGMSIHLVHFLVDVEDRFEEQLLRWSGDVDDLPGLRDMMEDFGRRGKWRVGDWEKLAA